MRHAMVLLAALAGLVFTLACQDAVTQPDSIVEVAREVWPDAPLSVDQSNPPVGGGVHGCGTTPPGQSLQQTFVSQSTTLPAVALYLKVYAESVTAEIQIRAGAGGPTLGTADVPLMGPTSTAEYVRFDLRPPLRIKPGQTYAIELFPVGLGWGGTRYAGGYPAGSLHGCDGQPHDGDAFFETYRLGTGN